jgi:hypothetical protein
MESEQGHQLNDAVIHVLGANLRLLVSYLSQCANTQVSVTDRNAKEFKFLMTIAHAEATLMELLPDEYRQAVVRQHFTQNDQERQALETLGPKLGLRRFRENTDADVNPGGPSYAIGINVKVVYCCADHTASTLAIELQGWSCTDNINAPDCPPIA